MQNRKRLTDLENKLLVAGQGGGEGCREGKCRDGNGREKGGKEKEGGKHAVVA